MRSGRPVPTVPGGTPAAADPVLAVLARAAGPARTCVAVTDESGSWTYAELADAAMRVVTALRVRSVEPGSLVGVSMPRTKEALAVLLGVLGAGSAYVPLDPTYPAARLATMRARARLDCVIGDFPSSDGPATAGQLDVTAALAAVPASHPCVPHPDAAAYILFTSGSTGEPKGVTISRGNLAALLRWARTAFTRDELARSSALASFNFDLSVLELFAPLVVGGSVDLFTSPFGFLDAPRPVTAVIATPTVLRELIGARAWPSSVQTVLVCGEVLTRGLAERVLALPVQRLLNTYGPTEATVLVTAGEIGPSAGGRDQPGVGHCIPGTTVHVLDATGAELPPGELGELYIVGQQVALGYVNDPGRSAASFTSIRLGGVQHRAYRTGDLGSQRPDGSFSFHGRLDRQVKVRGHRVELPEIESVLLRAPQVREASAVVAGTAATAHLVAYVSLLVPESDAVPALTRWMQDRLPPYMVPTRLEVLPELPRTSSGKTDVRALEARQSTTAVPDIPTRLSSTTAADRSALEVEVARIMQQLVRSTMPVGPDSDFVHELGGTSLGIVRLATQLEEQLGMTLPLAAIIRRPTPRALVDLFTGAAPSSPTGASWRRAIHLVHCYTGGLLRYRGLVAALPSWDVSMVMAQPDDGPAAGSVEEMAARVVDEVRSRQANGPYVLGGHSAGGLVAYEAGRQLVGAGQEVSAVLLLDTPVLRSHVDYLWQELVLNAPDLVSLDVRDRSERWRLLLAKRMSVRREGLGDARLSHVLEGEHTTNRAVAAFRARPAALRLAVVSTRQGRVMGLGRRDLGWTRCSPFPIEGTRAPGGHISLFDPPFLQVTARCVEDVLVRSLGLAGAGGPARLLLS